MVVEGDDGHVADLGGRKQRAVLAGLLLDLDRAVPAERLIGQVWGGEPPPRAAASLHAYVSKLRRQLEPGQPAGAGHEVLVTEPSGYRLVAGPDAVDLARFEDLRLEAAAALAAGDPAAFDIAWRRPPTPRRRWGTTFRFTPVPAARAPR